MYINPLRRNIFPEIDNGNRLKGFWSMISEYLSELSKWEMTTLKHGGKKYSLPSVTVDACHIWDIFILKVLFKKFVCMLLVVWILRARWLWSWERWARATNGLVSKKPGGKDSRLMTVFWLPWKTKAFALKPRTWWPQRRHVWGPPP